MKQKLLLLLLLCNVFFIFSCTKSAIRKTVEIEKTTLTIFVDLMGEDIRKTIMSEAVKQFGIVYPNVVLNVMYDSGASYKERLMEMEDTNMLPDVMYLWARKENDFLTTENKIKNLSSMFKPYEDEFLDVAVKQFIETDSLYIVPDYINTPIIIYANNSLLEQMNIAPATTYEELMLQGTIIREYGYTPIMMDTLHNYETQMSILSLFLLRFHETSWIFEEYYQWDPNTDTLIQTMEYFEALYSSNLLPRKNEIYNREEALKKFISGEAVYFIDTSLESKYKFFETLSINTTNIEVVSFPTFSNQKMSSMKLFPVIVGRGFGMKNYLEKSKEIAAKNWILFYAGKQGVQIKQKYNIRNISYKDDFVVLKQDDVLQATLRPFLKNEVDLHGVRISMLDENESITIFLQQLMNEMIEKKITPYEVIINFNILEHTGNLYLLHLEK